MIDAYCHCGVSKYLPLPDVQQMLAKAGVERAVLVQHLGEYDNGYLADVVAAHSETFRAVGLVDAWASEWEQGLASLLAGGRFRGLRLNEDMLRERPELGHEAAAAGLVLVLELPSGIRASSAAVATLADQGTSGIVISHLGYPRFDADGGVADRALLELAGVEDVYVLLTGHSMWLDFPYSALAELTSEVIESFGPGRVMWGSNFPVCGDAGVYLRDLALLRDGAYGLGPEAVRQVTHATAERLWFGGGGLDAIRQGGYEGLAAELGRP